MWFVILKRTDMSLKFHAQPYLDENGTATIYCYATDGNINYRVDMVGEQIEVTETTQRPITDSKLFSIDSGFMMGLLEALSYLYQKMNTKSQVP